MGSRVVSVRLDEETLKFVDELAKLGLYGSRSEALRNLIRAGAECLGYVRVIETVNKLLELERSQEEIPVKLKGGLKQMLIEREKL